MNSEKNAGIKKGAVLQRERLLNEDESMRDKQTKRQNKNLPADFQSDALHGKCDSQGLMFLCQTHCLYPITPTALAGNVIYYALIHPAIFIHL